MPEKDSQPKEKDKVCVCSREAMRGWPREA